MTGGGGVDGAGGLTGLAPPQVKLNDGRVWALKVFEVGYITMAQVCVTWSAARARAGSRRARAPRADAAPLPPLPQDDYMQGFRVDGVLVESARSGGKKAAPLSDTMSVVTLRVRCVCPARPARRATRCAPARPGAQRLCAKESNYVLLGALSRMRTREINRRVTVYTRLSRVSLPETRVAKARRDAGFT